MSTDCELLEMAAKAAGYDAEWLEAPYGNCLVIGNIVWLPLEDDGDALRLAVKLALLNDLQTLIELYIEEADYFADPYSATRRAIVRAAAEIGKAMS